MKGRIVWESFRPGARVCEVARRHGISPQQVTTWRRAARDGLLALPEDPGEVLGPGFVPVEVGEPADAPTGATVDMAGAIEIIAGGVTVRLSSATGALLVWDGTGLVLTYKRLDTGASSGHR